MRINEKEAYVVRVYRPPEVQTVIGMNTMTLWGQGSWDTHSVIMPYLGACTEGEGTIGSIWTGRGGEVWICHTGEPHRKAQETL